MVLSISYSVVLLFLAGNIFGGKAVPIESEFPDKIADGSPSSSPADQLTFGSASQESETPDFPSVTVDDAIPSIDNNETADPTPDLQDISDKIDQTLALVWIQFKEYFKAALDKRLSPSTVDEGSNVNSVPDSSSLSLASSEEAAGSPTRFGINNPTDVLAGDRNKGIATRPEP